MEFIGVFSSIAAALLSAISVWWIWDERRMAGVPRLSIIAEPSAIEGWFRLNVATLPGPPTERWRATVMVSGVPLAPYDGPEPNPGKTAMSKLEGLGPIGDGSSGNFVVWMRLPWPAISQHLPRKVRLKLKAEFADRRISLKRAITYQNLDAPH